MCAYTRACCVRACVHCIYLLCVVGVLCACIMLFISLAWPDPILRFRNSRSEERVWPGKTICACACDERTHAGVPHECTRVLCAHI